MKTAPRFTVSLLTILVAVAAAAHGQQQGRWRADLQRDKTLKVTLQNGEANQRGLGNLSFNLPLVRMANADFAYGSSNHNAHFSLEAEAGTIDFRGVVSGDTGTGTYSFTPDPQFPKKMGALGFTVTPEQQVLFVPYNVTSNYAKTMRDATDVDTAGRLLKMARLRIDADFVRKLSKAFGERLEAEEVIEAARNKVTPEYVAAVHKLLPHTEFDDIRRLHRRNVSVQFIAAAQRCRGGVTAKEIEDLNRTYASPCAK